MTRVVISLTVDDLQIQHRNLLLGVVDVVETVENGRGVIIRVMLQVWSACFSTGVSSISKSRIRNWPKGKLNLLVILDEKDTVIEEEYTRQELGKLGWTSDIKVLKGATHKIVRSHAKEVAELVGQFWESLEK